MWWLGWIPYLLIAKLHEQKWWLKGEFAKRWLLMLRFEEYWIRSCVFQYFEENIIIVYTAAIWWSNCSCNDLWRNLRIWRVCNILSCWSSWWKLWLKYRHLIWIEMTCYWFLSVNWPWVEHVSILVINLM